MKNLLFTVCFTFLQEVLEDENCLEPDIKGITNISMDESND